MAWLSMLLPVCVCVGGGGGVETYTRTRRQRDSSGGRQAGVSVHGSNDDAARRCHQPSTGPQVPSDTPAALWACHARACCPAEAVGGPGMSP
jgi:hypothetical protein